MSYKKNSEQLRISKLFKFIVHENERIFKINGLEISKLFKFIVHGVKLLSVLEQLKFQNFSSL